MTRIRIRSAALALIAAPLLLSVVPARAAEAATTTPPSTTVVPADTPPPVDPGTDSDSLGMTPIGTDDPGIVQIKGADGPVLSATGSGGRSSASGCARFYVSKTHTNLLGSEAFKVRVWTDACWNRATHSVTVKGTGRTVLFVGSTWAYKGVISTDRRYYTWNGVGSGGYHHYELLSFENCVVKYGCVGYNNPRMTINVHYNGTYNWYTDGDANG